MKNFKGNRWVKRHNFTPQKESESLAARILRAANAINENPCRDLGDWVYMDYIVESEPSTTTTYLT